MNTDSKAANVGRLVLPLALKSSCLELPESSTIAAAVIIANEDKVAFKAMHCTTLLLARKTSRMKASYGRFVATMIALTHVESFPSRSSSRANRVSTNYKLT